MYSRAPQRPHYPCKDGGLVDTPVDADTGEGTLGRRADLNLARAGPAQRRTWLPSRSTVFQAVFR